MTNPHSFVQPSRVDYLLVLLLICLSGNQAFLLGQRNEFFLIAAFIIIFFRMIKLRRGIETQTFLLVLIGYAAIVLLQWTYLPYLSLLTIFGLLTKLVIGAGVIATVRNFRLAFVKIMVLLAAMSLVIHIPTLFAASIKIEVYQLARPLADFIGAHSEGAVERVNILIHNFTSGGGVFRNSGMFWEPGAFSGYLVLAMIFLATIQSDLPKALVRKWRTILLAAELTTLSTTGFLFLPFALFLFPLSFTETKRDFRNRSLWLFLFLLFLVPVSSVGWNLDFIGPKITELVDRAVNQDAGWQLSRFGAVMFDWAHIKERPLFGWSQSSPEIYSLFPMLQEYATGNGLSGYVREMGFSGLFIFLISLWVGLGRIGIKKLSRIVAFWVIVLQLNGQSFLTYPLYLSLHFIGLELNDRSVSARLARIRLLKTRLHYLKSPRAIPAQILSAEVK